MKNGLPEGWKITPLGEIAQINPRHPKEIDDSIPVTFAPMAAISESKPEFQFLKERPLGEVRKGFTHFAERDVLFAKITPCMENGKGAVAIGLRNGLGCGTTELHVLRPLERLDPYFLYRFLAQPSIRRMAKEKFTGTAGQARVPISFIEQLEIPLPPLPEQRRIVAKLEKLLAKVDASRQRLAKVPILLKRFRQSVLAAACSGRLTADWREKNLGMEPVQRLGKGKPPEEIQLPASWDWWLSERIFNFVTSGSRGWAKYYSSIGALFIRVGNLEHGSIKLDLKDVQHVRPPQSAEGRRTRVQMGDILISITADVGMIALVDQNMGEAYINQHVALARPSGNLDKPFPGPFPFS